MKRPVKTGDLIYVEVDGVGQYYRARRAVRNLTSLRLCDLQHDPVTDANAAIARAIAAQKEGGS